ncbi:MAG: zinc-binding dehydrogenase [Acidimicrobiales bacterium]
MTNLTETMKATRMLEVGRMICEEIPVPPISDGQVLVRSEMASICGSDLHIVMMGAGVSHPTPCPHGYPGHEGIGTIVESKAQGLEPGTHVLTFPNPFQGECFNQYQRVGAKYCMALPDTDVARTELLMAQQLGTVVWARKRFPRDVTGETVAVVGQGSAGLFWTYLLKRAGAEKVIVSDLSDARLALAAKYGADVTVNASTDSLGEAVADLTGGRGVDYAVEAVGRSETFLSSVELPRVDGELMWFGLPSNDAPIQMDFNRFFRKRLKAASVYGAQDEPKAASFAEALDLIADRQIDVAPLLSHVYDVEQIDEAMHMAHEPVDAGALKVSVRFS